jgi:uncharacterized membrane protein YhdT
MQTIINYFKDMSEGGAYVPFLFVFACIMLILFYGAVIKLAYLAVKNLFKKK